jgi:hypothetical protein
MQEGKEETAQRTYFFFCRSKVSGEGEDEEEFCRFTGLELERPQFYPPLGAPGGFSQVRNENGKEEQEVEEIKEKAKAHPEARVHHPEKEENGDADGKPDELLFEVEVA